MVKIIHNIKIDRDEIPGIVFINGVKWTKGALHAVLTSFRHDGINNFELLKYMDKFFNIKNVDLSKEEIDDILSSAVRL